MSSNLTRDARFESTSIKKSSLSLSPGLTKGLTNLYRSNILPANPYQAFIESRKAQGVSPNTLKYYQERLSKAFKILGNPYKVSFTDIQTYLNTITANERGLATRHASFRTLKTFYRWLENVYGLPYPMKNMPAPHLNKLIMPTLKLGQISDILKTESVRNKAIIALATESGLRLSELANVNLEDIDWQSGKVKTLGKGRKEAYAPIGALSLKYMNQWLFESGVKSGSLFGLNKWGIKSVFRRIEERTGYKSNPHVFRRSFATILRELGVDVLTIMQLGRWENPAMVQRYTRAFDFDSALKLYKSPLQDLVTV